MRMTKSTFRTVALTMALALPLSACVSFGSKPPSQLLSLTAEKRVQPGAGRSVETGASLTVLEPDTAKKFDTNRIPVQVNETAIAYVKEAQWVDTPRQMFQRLLSETIAATTGSVVLDPRQYSSDAGRRLMGEIIEFGIDARTNSATVTYDATLLSPDGTTVMKHRFSVTKPVRGAIDALSASQALNAAANDVASDVATWVAAG